MKIRKLLFVTIVMTLAGSCHKSDFNKPPIGLLYQGQVANKDGVEGLLIGAYSLLDGFSSDEHGGTGFYGTSTSNWLWGSICGTEAHTGSQQTDQPQMRDIEKFNATASDYYFDAKWNSVYTGVARTNTVLRVMREAKDMTPADTTEVRAEALFLRAFYHFEAAKLWHNVPFVDDNVTYDKGNYYLDNTTPIWPAIERDLKYAMDNLPEIQDAVGRANKYAAEAFLAKAYMFDEKFNDAKTLLNELIQKGVTAKGIPYQLMPNFGDNFNIEFKNQSESVFAVQASVNDGSGGLNGNMADVLNFPQTSIPTNIPGQCCGFFQPSQYLVDLYKTDSVTGLPDLNSGVSVKNDQGISSDSVFTPYSGTLDPRLDWTVGRRGVPYLDWGPDPGMGWIRDQNYSGPYLPKKNIYYESQQQKFTESTFWTTGATANNVNLLRFSDILLWAAEAEIETNGDLNKARDYVNQVRQRAANTPGLVKNDDNSPNAKATTNSQAEFDVFNDPAYPLNPYDWVVRKDINQTWVFLKTNSDGTKVWNAYTPPRYNIQIYTDAWTDPNFARKAVRYERALELAMEGHRFFDLVRWGIADIEINNYLQKEQKLRTYLNDAKFRKGKNEYYPIPQIEIDLSTDANGIAHLIQNPGY